MYYCDNTGVELTLKEDSAQKADHEEENSPGTPAGT